jgi:hypothetical protein
MSWYGWPTLLYLKFRTSSQHVLEQCLRMPRRQACFTQTNDFTLSVA